MLGHLTVLAWLGGSRNNTSCGEKKLLNGSMILEITLGKMTYKNENFFILSWILYEKPNFEGPSVPLEEGELELSDIWGASASEEQNECKSVVIGSIRHVVKASNVIKENVTQVLMLGEVLD